MRTSISSVRWFARSFLGKSGSFWLSGVVLVTGCGHEIPPKPAASSANWVADDRVARVGDVTISREAFEREWARRGHRPDKQTLLDEMIASAAVLDRAKAAGYDRDPDMVARINQLVAARFQEVELASRAVADGPVEETEVERFYQANKERYTAPEAVRAAVIVVKCSLRATAERRAAVKAEAGSLLTKARQSDAHGFTLLVSRHSEDQVTRYVGGDTGWLPHGESSLRWPAAVIEAAWALSRPGDIAPLVAAPDGFYIVRLTERKPAIVRPLDDVREAIRYQLAREQQHRRERDFFEEMKRTTKIEINTIGLDSIPTRLHAGEQPPSAPPGS